MLPRTARRAHRGARWGVVVVRHGSATGAAELRVRAGDDRVLGHRDPGGHFHDGLRIFHERDGARHVARRHDGAHAVRVRRRATPSAHRGRARDARRLPRNRPRPARGTACPSRPDVATHYPVRVRFSDVDVYGHVNNVKLLRVPPGSRIAMTARMWGTSTCLPGRRPDRRRLRAPDPVPARAVRRVVLGLARRDPLGEHRLGHLGRGRRAGPRARDDRVLRPPPSGRSRRQSLPGGAALAVELSRQPRNPRWCATRTATDEMPSAAAVVATSRPTTSRRAMTSRSRAGESRAGGRPSPVGVRRLRPHHQRRLRERVHVSGAGPPTLAAAVRVRAELAGDPEQPARELRRRTVERPDAVRRRQGLGGQVLGGDGGVIGRPGPEPDEQAAGVVAVEGARHASRVAALGARHHLVVRAHRAWLTVRAALSRDAGAGWSPAWSSGPWACWCCFPGSSGSACQGPFSGCLVCP